MDIGLWPRGDREEDGVDGVAETRDFALVVCQEFVSPEVLVGVAALGGEFVGRFVRVDNLSPF